MLKRLPLTLFLLFFISFGFLTIARQETLIEAWKRLTRTVRYTAENLSAPNFIVRELGPSSPTPPSPEISVPKTLPDHDQIPSTPPPQPRPLDERAEMQPMAKDAASRVFPLASAEGNVSYLMSLSEEQVAALVPDQSGIHFTDCPACDAATQDFGNFKWNPEQPNRIVCSDCGETFPRNPKYPDNHSLKVRSLGQTHKYPYHEMRSGYRLYFQAKADALAREYMARNCRDLARIWWATKEDAYAIRAASILVRFAAVYPGYALHYDYPFQEKVIMPPTRGPIPKTAKHGDGRVRIAKWSWWGYMDLSRELTEAYDILRHWTPLREMAGGRAVGMIENDLLGAMMERTMGFDESYSNMSPTKWRAAIEAARVLRRPEPIHDIVSRLDNYMNSRFHYDGSWFENSPSYAEQVWGNLGIIEATLKGYSDLADYRHPVTGRNLHIKDVEELLARRERIDEVLNRTSFPDGRLLPVNDTWADNNGRPVRERMEAALTPGFGVAVMGGGEGATQWHAYLNFTSGVSHNQKATLTLGLWANGKELLSDIGYTHTIYRYWASCTPSHNTVTVDGLDQDLDSEYNGNCLRLWASDKKGFHAVEAESKSAYPQIDRYRRTLLAIGNNSNDSYLVDVFQVHGGQQHDYILAGSADDDSHATLNVKLQPFDGTLSNPGVRFTRPTAESDSLTPKAGLSFIKNLSWAENQNKVVLDSRLDDDPQIGVRSWLDAGPQTDVFLGDAPSLRRAKSADALVETYRMPMFVARRKGSALRSAFAAVHEPLRKDISGIEAVDIDRQGQAMVIKVRRGKALDLIIVALEGPARLVTQTPDGLIDFDGRIGMVRVIDGRGVEAHMIGGSVLNFGDIQLTATPSYTGKIIEAHRQKDLDGSGWFLVPEQLPEGDSYAVLLVRLPDGTTQGYNVVRVERQKNGCRILVRESPSFDLSAQSIQTRFFPIKTIKNPSAKYELITAKHYSTLN